MRWCGQSCRSSAVLHVSCLSACLQPFLSLGDLKPLSSEGAPDRPVVGFCYLQPKAGLDRQGTFSKPPPAALGPSWDLPLSVGI